MPDDFTGQWETLAVKGLTNDFNKSLNPQCMENVDYFFQLKDKELSYKELPTH